MAKTCNNFGQVVEGSIVQLPNIENDVFIVGEIFTNKCKLYSMSNSKLLGEYELEYIKDYLI